MAVHKRAYRPYEGPLDLRALALPGPAALRASWSCSSRACSPRSASSASCPSWSRPRPIYIAYSPAARALLEMSEPRRDFDAQARRSSSRRSTIQGALAFLLTAWVAPVLVSPDLVNGALPLYLSRPFTRAEYVLGKATVLLTLLSAITWVPGARSCSPWRRGWPSGLGLAPTSASPWAVFVGSWVWIARAHAPRPRHLRLDPLADGGQRRPARRLLHGGGLRGDVAGGAATTRGDAWRTSLPDGTRLADLFGLFKSHIDGPGDARRPPAATCPPGRPGRAWPRRAALSVWLLERRLRAREVVS